MELIWLAIGLGIGVLIGMNIKHEISLEKDDDKV